MVRGNTSLHVQCLSEPLRVTVNQAWHKGTRKIEGKGTLVDVVSWVYRYYRDLVQIYQPNAFINPQFSSFLAVVQNNPKPVARVSSSSSSSSSSPHSMRSNYTGLIGPGSALNPDPVADVVGSGVGTRSELISRLAQNHPLCIDNVTAYVGQTARMFCCLARLDRELSVSICPSRIESASNLALKRFS